LHPLPYDHKIVIPTSRKYVCPGMGTKDEIYAWYPFDVNDENDMVEAFKAAEIVDNLIQNELALYKKNFN